jgi:hypothetical protein
MGDNRLILAHHRVETTPEMLQSAPGYNLRIRDTELKRQNYGKGPDRFVRKFDPDVETSATISLYDGRYGDHGWAVYGTQESRCCCLLGTTCGLSPEEIFWTALSAWATFQPRAAKPPQAPRNLFYPNEFSQTMENYWDSLHCLDQHPDFSNQSDYCQRHMSLFSQAISSMPRLDNLEPKPVAEATQADVDISDDAAISRLRPIQDGLDFWQILVGIGRCGHDTGSGGLAPG